MTIRLEDENDSEIAAKWKRNEEIRKKASAGFLPEKIRLTSQISSFPFLSLLNDQKRGEAIAKEKSDEPESSLQILGSEARIAELGVI